MLTLINEPQTTRKCCGFLSGFPCKKIWCVCAVSYIIPCLKLFLRTAKVLCSIYTENMSVMVSKHKCYLTVGNYESLLCWLPTSEL